MGVISCLAKELLASQEGLCMMKCVSLLHILILPQFNITHLSLSGQGGFMSDVYLSVQFLAGLTATLTAFFGVFFCLSSKFWDTCCK